MRVANLLMSDQRAYVVCGVVLLLAVWAAWPYLRGRRRPKCLMSPLEVRAHDAADALIEIDEALTALAEQKRTLPNELLPAWIKAKTAGHYLKRFLDTGR